MSKLNKKAKMSLIIIAIITLVSVIASGIFVMRKKAEDYILKEARIGLKVYFEKYYNGVDPNSIKMEIKFHHHMVSGPYVEGYVNGDKDLNFDCDVIKVPKYKIDNEQDKLGIVIAISGTSYKLDKMMKYEYSDNNPNRKIEKRPSELIPKSEVEKVKGDRYLLNFIPEMMHY